MGASVVSSGSLNITDAASGMTINVTLSKSFDQAGTEFQGGVQEVPDVVGAIDVGSVDDIEAIIIVNNDDAETLEVYLDNGGLDRFSTIPPKDFVILKRPPLALYWKGSAALEAIVGVAEA